MGGRREVFSHNTKLENNSQYHVGIICLCVMFVSTVGVSFFYFFFSTTQCFCKGSHQIPFSFLNECVGVLGVYLWMEEGW